MVLQVCAATVCFLGIFLPHLLVSSLPLNFAILGLASWGIFVPAVRGLANRLCFFILSLSGILVSSSYIKQSGLTFNSLGTFWLSMWIALILGINTLLPHFQVRYGLLVSAQAFDPPNNEPDRTAWKWKETAYIGTVMRPVGELFFFSLMAAVVWFYRAANPPPSWIGIDAPSAMGFALLVPFGFLMGWSLSWSKEVHSKLVVAPIPVWIGVGTNTVLLLLLYVWGLVVQLSQNTAQLPMWTVCVLVLAMLSVVLARLGSTTTREKDTPDGVALPPKIGRKLVALQTLTMIVVTFLYLGLLIRTLGI